MSNLCQNLEILMYLKKNSYCFADNFSPHNLEADNFSANYSLQAIFLGCSHFGKAAQNVLAIQAVSNIFSFFLFYSCEQFFYQKIFMNFCTKDSFHAVIKDYPLVF